MTKTKCPRLTPSLFEVLRRLDGKTTMQAIGSKVKMSRQAVHQLVQLAARDGLTRNDGSGRWTRTARGLALVVAIENLPTDPAARARATRSTDRSRGK